MSSVDDIMAVLLEAPAPTKKTMEAPTKKTTTTATANKPGRGRPATRASKQMGSSLTITSKPTSTITSTVPTNKPAQQQQQQQMANKETNNKKQHQQTNGTQLSQAQISRLEQEYVKVKILICFSSIFCVFFLNDNFKVNPKSLEEKKSWMARMASLQLGLTEKQVDVTDFSK